MAYQDLLPEKTKLPNGIILNHIRQGSGPALIFVHGAMGDYRSWAPQWDSFTGAFDCIAYSRRYSYPNPNQLTTRAHNALVDAEDLDALMETLGIPEAILIGSSYGGFTALAMALRAPGKVRAVVSVEAPMMRYAMQTEAEKAVAEAFLAAAALPARAAFEQGDDALGVSLLTGGITGRKPVDLPDHVMQRRMQNARAARSLALSDDEFPLLDPAALAALSMPVLLLSGAQTAPVHAAIFANVRRAMPQARVRIVEGSGHSVSQQQSAVFNAEVKAFLADHGMLAETA